MSNSYFDEAEKKLLELKELSDKFMKDESKRLHEEMVDVFKNMPTDGSPIGPVGPPLQKKEWYFAHDVSRACNKLLKLHKAWSSNEKD